MAQKSKHLSTGAHNDNNIMINNINKGRYFPSIFVHLPRTELSNKKTHGLSANLPAVTEGRVLRTALQPRRHATFIFTALSSSQAQRSEVNIFDNLKQQFELAAMQQLYGLRCSLCNPVFKGVTRLSAATCCFCLQGRILEWAGTFLLIINNNKFEDFS